MGVPQRRDIDPGRKIEKLVTVDVLEHHTEPFVERHRKQHGLTVETTIVANCSPVYAARGGTGYVGGYPRDSLRTRLPPVSR